MVDSAKPVTGPWVVSIMPVKCPDDLAGVPDGYIRAWEEHIGPVGPAGGDREDWIEMCARLYWGVRNLGDDAIVRVHGRWRGDDGSLAGLPHFGHVLAHCQTPDQVADSSLASRYRLNPVVRGLMHRPSETCSIGPPDVRAAFARLIDRGAASFLVKYAVREKALPNLPLDGTDPDILADRVAGWLAEDWESMRAEGVPDALLVQKRVRMEYEYRMFMVGDEPACGAGNIGVLTPVDNEARFDPKMQRTRADMDRSTVERRPDLAERYREAAVRFGRALAGDGYGAYVLDLCLIDGEVSIVELNGMMNAGLFALDMSALTRAMRARPDQFVPVSLDGLLAGRDACSVPV